MRIDCENDVKVIKLFAANIGFKIPEMAELKEAVAIINKWLGQRTFQEMLSGIPELNNSQRYQSPGLAETSRTSNRASISGTLETSGTALNSKRDTSGAPFNAKQAMVLRKCRTPVQKFTIPRNSQERLLKQVMKKRLAWQKKGKQRRFSSIRQK